MGSGVGHHLGIIEKLRHCATSMPREKRVTLILIFWRAGGLDCLCTALMVCQHSAVQRCVAVHNRAQHERCGGGRNPSAFVAQSVIFSLFRLPL